MSNGAQLAQVWFEHSPFARHLALQLLSIEDDTAAVRLPYTPQIATIGDVVHGGAISSLMDTAAALAAWSSHEAREGARGATVGLSVTFQAAAEARDVIAHAQVSRRGAPAELHLC